MTLAKLHSKAVVLGGGGPVGIAWEAGILAGLLQEGVDLRNADAVFGTSAGAFVGASLACGYDLLKLWEAQRMPTERRQTTVKPHPALSAKWKEAYREGGTDTEKIGRLIGAAARGIPPATQPDARRKVVRSRLVTDMWPETLYVTAVDVDTGRLHILHAGMGISLEEGVSASSAYPGVSPVESFLGKDWIDGGIVSSTNAHLAKDYKTVVIIAPAPGGEDAPFGAYAEAAALQEHSAVFLLTPDQNSLSAMGGNWFDAGRAPSVAQAGFTQGARAAVALHPIWLD